jgi:hypothetical protein
VNGNPGASYSVIRLVTGTSQKVGHVAPGGPYTTKEGRAGSEAHMKAALRMYIHLFTGDAELCF